MLILGNDQNYKVYEEMLEKRLKTYIQLEKEKIDGENILSFNSIIYPKHSSSLTFYDSVAETYFDVMNNLEYHYYSDSYLMLQGFFNYSDVRIPTEKFILRTTLKDFQIELLSLSNNLNSKDEVYVNYIVRKPIDGTHEKTIKVFVNNKFKQIRSKGKYYHEQQVRIINKTQLYRITNSKQIKEQKKEYYNRKKSVRKKYNMNYRVVNSTKVKEYEKHYRLFKKCVANLFKEEQEKNILETIGCSMRELKKHIQKQFTEEMNWGNIEHYWVIGYKQAISRYHTKEECIKLNHYTNLCPLKIIEK